MSTFEPPEEDNQRRTYVEAATEGISTGGGATRFPTALTPRGDAREVAALPSENAGDTGVYRPIHRPPMAILQVLDDGRKSAEFVRLRQSRLTIGRAEGDLTIPHDPQISSRHAEIVRVQSGEQYRWLLHDLGSTNGTFVRVRGMLLKPQMEIMLARHRFRFVIPDPGPEGTSEPGEPDDRKPGGSRHEQVNRTISWAGDGPPPATPCRPYLLDLQCAGAGRRLVLGEDSQWIGRDDGLCNLVLPGETTINPRHARIWRNEQGAWHIEDNCSLNGIWLRITGEMPLASHSCFLLGEQMFVLVIP